MIGWYKIQYDRSRIQLHVHPPNMQDWEETIYWEDIIRICYEKGDFLTSDTCYIFVNDRESSIAIPLMGVGGSELWGEILERDFFPAECFLKFLTSEDKLLCHEIRSS